ncbi:hypothetical protein BLOT_016820 [Blomia tropicalis]|nr:hypothetical protein BLOT_016820 [Blomia tropicalis]
MEYVFMLFISFIVFSILHWFDFKRSNENVTKNHIGKIWLKHLAFWFQLERVLSIQQNELKESMISGSLSFDAKRIAEFYPKYGFHVSRGTYVSIATAFPIRKNLNQILRLKLFNFLLRIFQHGMERKIDHTLSCKTINF